MSIRTPTSPAGPEPTADLEAVEAGQHAVEDDEVGRHARQVEPGAPVADGPHLEPLVAEPHLEELAHRQLVVDDEDPREAFGDHGLSRVVATSSEAGAGRHQAADRARGQ